ncbi:MAG: phosphomannomutase/phosphoglucomutase [Chloroflexi bacterium]|nr:phosphomannomutase/phosphoglucomutase [Chloroflexota bacterium]
MTIDPGIFRAYDVRGKVGPSITTEVAEALGRAFGTYIADGPGAEIAVGRDNRSSGEELKAALMRGLVSTGCTVLDIGMVTSPALYFSVGHWGLTGGVNVTGSHNPPDENGFKFVGDGNRPVAGDELQEIKKIIEGGSFRSAEGKIVGRDIRPEYFDRLRRAAKLTRPFRVVVDTGNGVAGLFAPKLLREIGCEVIELYCDLDPTFPNHPPDPQMPENVRDLQEKVREEKADLGLAFDGDGDRLGVIDEAGDRHEADYVLMLLARGLLKEQPGSTVIVDIKTSQPVIDDIAANGGEPLVWKTGHSLIKLKMREAQAPLAGEASGHMFYGENFYSDDALFAACKLLTFLSGDDRPLSAHLRGMSRWYTTAELRVPCPDDRKAAVVEAVASYLRERHPSVEIDGIRATYPDGWALVRASNTGPNLTLRFESKTEAGLREISDEVLGVLRQHVDVPE